MRDEFNLKQKQELPDCSNQASTQAYSPMAPEGIVDEIFKYHSPTLEQVPKYETVREAARHFARVILSNVPYGADQKAAIRLLREAVMTANAGIALNGLSF